LGHCPCNATAVLKADTWWLVVDARKRSANEVACTFFSTEPLLPDTVAGNVVRRDVEPNNACGIEWPQVTCFDRRCPEERGEPKKPL